MLGKRLTIMININHLLHTRCRGAGQEECFVCCVLDFSQLFRAGLAAASSGPFFHEPPNWWGIVSVFETLERLCGFQNVTTA